MIGSTKTGEHARTVEMLMKMTNKPKEDIARILYFLYDSQYSNSDLKTIADSIINKQLGIF